MELSRFADFRMLVEKQLPKEYRFKFAWRQLARLLRRAAEGQEDVAETSTALRVVLQLKGVKCRAWLSLSPFFGLVLAPVVPGALVVLLLALLRTHRRWQSDAFHRRGRPKEADASFIVRTITGKHIYVHFEDEPSRRTAANLLTRDEARRIAANIAKLPGFLKRPQY